MNVGNFFKVFYSLLSGAFFLLFIVARLAIPGEIEDLKEQVKILQQRLEALEKVQKDSQDKMKDMEEGQIRVENFVEVVDKESKGDTGLSRWVVTGNAFTGFTDKDDEPESFFFGAFAPALLFQFNDRLLFETELEIELEKRGEVELEVEFAQIDWLVHDYLTLVIGKFNTPFNIFSERSEPFWINRLPTEPLSAEFLPNTEIGIQARGGINLPLNTKFEYALFLANGPELITRGPDAGNLIFGENFSDVNDNRVFGGRIGFLPIPGLEVGASLYKGEHDPDGDLDLEIFGFHSVFQYKNLDLRFEWANLTQEMSRKVLDKFPAIAQNFERKRPGDWRIGDFYVQGAYKLTDIPIWAEFLNNFEPVFRYSEVDLPGKLRDSHQITLGLNYWISPSAVIKLGYEFEEERTGEEDNNLFIFQAAYGF